MTPRTRRILLVCAGTLLALAAALAAVLWWGPVPVSDKRVLLDFLLGRGIEPPAAATVAARLKVPPGFECRSTRAMCHSRGSWCSRKPAT